MRSCTLLLVLAGTVAAQDAAPTFAKDIAPLFTQRCTECHGDKKSKAGLRLDSLELVLKGAKSGPVVVPGKAQESGLVTSISHPADHEDIMPPKGKPLTPEQIALVSAWINAGAK